MLHDARTRAERLALRNLEPRRELALEDSPISLRVCGLQYNPCLFYVVPQLTLRHALSRIALALLAVLAATCSPTKPGPIVPELAIQSVSPSTGPATGGTELTIRGVGFAAGTVVTIGGRAATDVTVRGTDTITAKTPASPTAGPSDVTVALNGRTHALSGGFRYDTLPANTAPVITSITAQGKRPRQPSNFADYGETVVLTAVVVDAQTAPGLLKYEWHPCEGAVVGSGPIVEWKAPSGGSLASTCTINLTVSDGPRVVIGSLPVRLHNSVAEVRGLALEFLEEFANSMIPAETTVRNFSELSDECRAGKAAELAEIQTNRRDFRHDTHTYGAATATVNFGAVCAFRARPGDACIATPVEWRSTKIATGIPEIAKGVSHITGVYQGSRWWLCRSEYRPDAGTSLTFMY